MSFIKKILDILVLLFLTFALVCLSILLYIRQIWPNIDYEQILITLYGLSFSTIANNIVLSDYFFAFLFFALIYPPCYFFLNTKQQFLAAIVFSISFLWFSGFLSYRVYQNITSTLFEEEYINPRDIKYTFPEKKRNLVLIYLESFEQNFTSAEHYGQNLLPNLTTLQKEGTFFEGHNDISGTGFSIASLVASHCGIPLRYLPNRDIYATKYFLPQAVCFPEILKENGYQTAFIKAADITFTNAHIFAKSHGYDEALGVDEILQTFPPKQHDELMGTFGGVTDVTLFTYAKDKLAQFPIDKPFMLTLFSLDTHTPSPHYNPKCPKIFNDIRDVYMCSDKTVYDFITWLKSSPYWENTTVILMGDHLLPAPLKSKGKTRRGIFNVFLNLPEELKVHGKRDFSTFDMTPSILESLGIHLSTKAFGLGRSLFAEKQTLIEKLGFTQFKNRLVQNSELYNNFNQLPLQRLNVFQPYNLGDTITNGDLPNYTDAYEEFLEIYYIDRLNIKISQNISNPIHVTMRFNAISSKDSKIMIKVNNHDVFTHTSINNEKYPQTISFDIPASIVSDGQIQFKFRNTFGISSAMQMGIAPLEITLTTE